MRRSIVGLLLAVGMLAPTVAAADQNPYVGTWEGTIKVGGIRVLAHLALKPNRTYHEELHYGEMVNEDSGHYAVVGDDVLRLVPTDWNPKEQCVSGPECVPVHKPPIATYQAHLAWPNTLTLRDPHNKSTVVYHRVSDKATPAP